MKHDRGRSSFGLTASGRGWYKRLPGAGPKWIASFNNAPTAADADRIFADRYGKLIDTPAVNAVTVDYACNTFIIAREADISPQTHAEYKQVLKHFKANIGANRLIGSLGPAEFTKYAGTITKYSVGRRSKIVGIIRTVFNWCVSQQWIEAMHYGPEFVQPSKKKLRIDLAKRKKKLFSAAQVHALLDHANPMMRAAILLGINGGLGPSDVSRLTIDMIDGDLLRADRQKTGATRIVPLWPQTQEALKVLTPDAEGFLFYGRGGARLETLHHRGIIRRFADLCDAAEVSRDGFYTLRRTFRTVTDDLPDRRAVELVMGHAAEDMGAVYVQRIHPDRLRVVTAHMLKWFSSSAAEDASDELQDGPAQ